MIEHFFYILTPRKVRFEGAQNFRRHIDPSGGNCMARNKKDSSEEARTKKRRKKRKSTALVLKHQVNIKKYETKHTVVPADEFGFIDLFKMLPEQKELLSAVYKKNVRKLSKHEKPEIQSVSTLILFLTSFNV